MRKRMIWLAMLVLFAVVFSGCGTEEPENTHRTMVYRQAFENLDGLDTVRVSNTVRTEEGYSYLYGSNNRAYGKTGGVVYVQTDTDGNIVLEMPLTAYGDGSGDALFLGERGIYVWGLWHDYEAVESYRSLIRSSFEGEQEAWADITVLREKGRVNDTTKNRTHLFAEREDGIALVWDNLCILADDNFVRTSAFELPGNGSALFVDGTEFWIVYEKGTGLNLGRFTEDGTETETYVLPDRFLSSGYAYQGCSVLTCENGYLTAWDSEGVYRWKMTLEEEEEPAYDEIMDFLDAGIADDYVQNVVWIPGEYDGEFMVAGRAALHNSAFVQRLYRPDPTIDLSTMETLILACIQPESSLTQAVVEFNRSRTDLRIEVLDYGIYNTEEEPWAGRTRLMLDLTTGVLEPDIVFLLSYDFQELADAADGYFVDLYTMMDGEVTKDTIYGCVRNTLEDEKGHLYGIAPEFTLSTLVGRRDAIGDAEKWSLTEFLDFSDSLGEGEYLMEEVAQYNCESQFFSFLSDANFVRDGKAYYDSPEYIRRLEFMKSLPTEPRKYMDHGSNNLQDLYAGDITADEVEVIAGGENLYHNGKIKLTRMLMMQAPHHFTKAAYTFGAESPADLNFIGYPVDDRCMSGITVNMSYGLYAIPACTKNAEVAWDFIESRMTVDNYLTYAENSREGYVGTSYFFKSYKPDYDKYLDAIEGYSIFYLHEGGSTGGWDFELDADGLYKNRPGILYVIDREMIEAIRHILDTAGVPLWYSNVSRTGIRQIVEEEESRFLSGNATAEATADAIQSRVSIWLSEHE